MIQTATIDSVARGWKFTIDLTECEACHTMKECLELPFFNRECEEEWHYQCFDCYQNENPISCLLESE